MKNLLTLVLFSTFAFQCSNQNRPADQHSKIQMNIVLIVADDLGYGDLGCYGQQTIKTPNLDKMAASGMRFTDFYAGNTVCAPSRYSLMTGLHMGHSRIRANAGGGNERGRIGDGVPLQDAEVTLAEVAKARGYVTGMFGKWGLGVRGTSGTPERQGFDHFLGFTNQVDAHKYYFDSLETIRRGELVGFPTDTTDYNHAIIMNAALEFVQANREKPFFLYLPVTIPHAELRLPPEEMEAYTDKNGESLFDEVPFTGSRFYRDQSMPRAAYAAMVSRLDRDIGVLMNALNAQGLTENTIVLFTSDNGPHAEGGYHPSYFDSNGPLRGHKRDLYEGGIRVPMIACGAGVPRGRISNEPLAFWDMLPTIADVLGYSGELKTDGLTFAPLLKGQKMNGHHDYLYWEFYFGGNKTFTQALRVGPWKLIRHKTEGREEPRMELYNLEQDIAEQSNVSASYPELVHRFTRQMEQISEAPVEPIFKYWKDFFPPMDSTASPQAAS